MSSLLFSLPFLFLSLFGYNVVIPWVFSSLHVYITVTSGISCLFFCYPFCRLDRYRFFFRAIRSAVTLLPYVRITAL